MFILCVFVNFVSINITCLFIMLPLLFILQLADKPCKQIPESNIMISLYILYNYLYSLFNYIHQL